MKTVLIVDPDYALNDIGGVIARQGLLSLVAPEAHTALHLVRGGLPVDAIIMELLLADMEGMDFLEAVRESAPQIPVLVVTAEYSIESYLRALNYRVFDYLHKPVRDSELCRSARLAVHLPRPGPISSDAA